MRSIITLAALIAAAVPLAPAAAQAVRGYTSGPTRLYAGPLRNYPSVRTLRPGTVVNLQGCLRDLSWCDVTYQGDRGWVAGNALNIRHDGRRRGIAPGMGIGVTTFAMGSYWNNHYQGRRFYGERQRWQSQYDSSYRPEWGEREQHRDENYSRDHDRGRMHERSQSEGQQRRDHADIPRSSAEPYRLPQHGERAAQPTPQNPRPGTDANGRNEHQGHRPDQGPAHDDATWHPHN